ncbi:MAG: ribosomal-protein-alanine N-acetyltransferase, partial [Proteobacteria bacterium]
MKKLPYSVRPAAEEDLFQVVDIEARSNRPAWAIEAFRAELNKPHAHFWVVTDNETDSQVLAYAVFALPADQAHVQTVAVRPDHRRQGLAQHLLRKVISFAMKNEADSLILELRKGNEAAMKLYQSVGFDVIRTQDSFYPDGEGAYVMVYKTEREKLSG